MSDKYEYGNAKPEPPLKAPPPTEWWVHVEDDQTERRYLNEPTSMRTLRVRLVKVDWHTLEETKTNSFKHREMHGKDWQAVRPRGVGWVLFQDNGDHSVWRRPRQPATQFYRAKNHMPQAETGTGLKLGD